MLAPPVTDRVLPSCWAVVPLLPVKVRDKLAIKHTTRTARALVKDVQYQLDVNTLHRDQDATALKLNEIGRVQLRTTVPLFFDEYRRNRTTGSFILVDEGTPWQVDAKKMATWAGNTPFDGMPVQGRATMMWKGGQRIR